ncbi:MAG TPA: hypothetical protein VKE69_10540 [Planctomycetota bacterium]|nr:hypothetical protein [Planctomycetota bacterium]
MSLAALALLLTAPQAPLETRVGPVAAEMAAVGVPVPVGELRVEVLPAAEATRRVSAFQERMIGARIDTLWHLLGACGLPVEESVADFRAHYFAGTATAQAAWYVPTDDVLVVVREMAPPDPAQADALLAHELTHVAQAKRGDLVQAYEKLGKSWADLLLARCVTEGEADAVSLAVMAARRGKKLGDLPPAASEASRDEIANGAIRYHYAAGRAFAVRRFREGGWDAVRAAVSKPPTSTEQIVHPDKLGKDLPADVALPADPIAGAKAVADDSFGELGVALVLTMLGAPSSQSQPAAIGWDGDHMRVWQMPDGSRAVAWRIVVDRDEDAQQLAAALRERAKATLDVRGRAVDLVSAKDDGTTLALRKALAATPIPPAGAATDASTTADAEKRWERMQPHVESGVWVRPDLGLRMSIPAGWTEEELPAVAGAYGGVRVLFAPIGDDPTFRDNVLVSKLPRAPVAAADARAWVREQFEAAGISLVRADAADVDGEPAVLVEYRSTSPQGKLHHLELQILRDDARVAVAATAREKRWKSVASSLEESIRSIHALEPKR